MKADNRIDNTERRSFLKLSGLLGLGAVAGSFIPTASAEAVLFNRKEYKVSSTRLAMGTFVAMTAIHSSRDQAEEAFGRAFDEIARLSRMLSRHDQGSPVTELNTAGQLAHAPRELQEVITRSLFYERETSGMFDITVKPLVDLYQRSFAEGREPSERDIQQMLSLTGADGIRIDTHSIRFTKPDMGITLDGIAKGYIVDRASEVLQNCGVVNHLINAGGDIRTSGLAARGKKWTIAVQDPQKRRAYPDMIEMANGAIATSGNYEVFYDHEKLFHHIVSARSGHSPQRSSSVSVVAPTVLEADALSTAVFVFEPDDGLAFIETQPNCECLVVEKGGAIRRSSGWSG